MTHSPLAAGASAQRLSTFNILAFASSGIPTAMMALMMSTYMPRFFAGHIGIPLVSVAAAFTLVRLIDIPFDPFIGSVMDKTRSRIGRYRLWMLIGAPLLMGSLAMIFMPPADADRNYLIFWLLIYYAGNSIFVLAHAAWAAALATGYNERSRVFGWMQAVGVVGSVSLLLLPLVTHGQVVAGKGESMKAIGWIVIAALPITVLIVAVFTPERISRDLQRERFGLGDFMKMMSKPTILRLIIADLCLVLGPGTTSPIYLFFFHDAKGFTIPQTSLLLIPYIGAGLLGAPTWARVAQKLGKHRTIQVACVCYAIAQTTLMALPKAQLGITAAGMFAVGFCASAFILLIRAMVADVADEVRLEGGKERSGLLFAMVTSTQKVGAAITVSIIFPILALVGYQAADDAVNTPEAIFGLEMCYLFAPIIFVLIGGAVFFGYRLDAKRHGEIRAELDARDLAELSPESAIIEQVTGSGTLPDVNIEPRTS